MAIIMNGNRDDSYKIIQLPEHINDAIEQLGTKEKFWLYDFDSETKLFKFGRPGTGENWAEKVACELAKLIELPCAEYDFSCWKGREGVITPLFVPKNGRLIHGNEILPRIIKNYPEHKRYQVRAYQLISVLAAIKMFPAYLPIGYCGNDIIKRPLDVFIGYIIFDCWISNQDRHHENWGIILDVPNKKVHLAPTYDHASGFGCRVTEEEMLERISTKDKRYNIDAFASKAKSAFYSLESKRFSTTEAVLNAAKQNKSAALYWIQKICDIRPESLADVFRKIPRHMTSDVAIDFSLAVLDSNKKRLLEIARDVT